MLDNQRHNRQQALPLGQIGATPGALAALTAAGTEPSSFLRRHACGDWGDVDEHDRNANRRALLEGTRVLSAYTLTTGARLWVITEWDRSLTTLLLPDEY